MEQKLRIAVYGDSLMKGTLPDEQLRYHFHTDLFEAPLAGVDAEVTNKSVFGATSRKGVTLVQRDLARGHRYDWALIEYGGNDCNYDWRTWPPIPSSTMTLWCWRMNSARTSRPSCRCCARRACAPSSRPCRPSTR